MLRKYIESHLIMLGNSIKILKKERGMLAGREEVSHKVAWAAVKQKYKKIKNDWKEKND